MEYFSNVLLYMGKGLVSLIFNTSLSLELSPNTAHVSSILNFDGNRIWIDGKFATLIVDNSTTGKKITRQYES